MCYIFVVYFFFFFSSRRRHTRCALVTGVQTCALPILVQVDTASSTANDIAAIRKAIDAAGHGRAVPARHHRLPRHHAVRDGRLGRRRRRPRLTEGADEAAGPRLRRGPAEGHGGAQEGGPAHPLLGLDRARGRRQLTKKLRTPTE